MKHFALIAVAALTSVGSLASAETVYIKCGDTSPAYVKLDLSRDFHSTFLTPEKMDAYRSNGFVNSYAGRNCDVSWSTTQQYRSAEVLILQKQNTQLLVRDAIQPFGIARATLEIAIENSEALNAGIVLTGNPRNLRSTDEATPASAVLSAARSNRIFSVSASDVVVIVRTSPAR
jgi:hypothetical protein